MITQDKETLNWLHRRALTVLAELMTSDDERIALRAAQATLAIIREQDTVPVQVDPADQDCEKRVPVRHIPRVMRRPEDAV